MYKTSEKTVKKNHRQWQWTRHRAIKKLFGWMRWLHVYLSSALFSLLLFFCITGLLLNNTSWFTGSHAESNIRHQVPADINARLQGSQPNLYILEQWVFARTGLQAPRSTDIDHELGEISLDYPLPAGYAFITINTGEAIMNIAYREGTLPGVLNDLHKGRHTGKAWSWLLDVSAILISLLSISGMAILLQLPRLRFNGLLACLGGAITPALVYWFFVPSFP